MNRRTLTKVIPAAALVSLLEIRGVLAKPSCRGAGHPSTGKGNTCCPGLVDNGKTCENPVVPPEPPVPPVPPVPINVVSGGVNETVFCATGEPLVVCCIHAVRKACRRKHASSHVKRVCRRRGTKRCRQYVGSE